MSRLPFHLRVQQLFHDALFLAQDFQRLIQLSQGLQQGVNRHA